MFRHLQLKSGMDRQADTSKYRDAQYKKMSQSEHTRSKVISIPVLCTSVHCTPVQQTGPGKSEAGSLRAK